MAAEFDKNGRRRVVVTGFGEVSPLGLDANETWHAILAGNSGVAPITRFDTSGMPTTIAASVKGFDPTRYLSPREARRSPEFVNYALAASQEALSHARLDLAGENLNRAGVEIGSAMGGVGVVEEQRLVYERMGIRHINPILIPSILINAAACRVSIQYVIKGPVNSPVAACATGTYAIGDAARWLAMGEVDLMLAGGTDSVMTPLAIAGFSRLGACSTKNDTPQQACSPFDAERDGTVVGEGAAILVLETLAHASRRGAPILAEILGFGFTADAYHVAAPDPLGEGAARSIAGALHDAAISPADLDWVSAHGTATLLNDYTETLAIKSSLGKFAYRVPVSSLKGALGHTMGAAGAMSAVAAIQAMQAGVIPPTINYRVPDPQCDLDYVPNHPRQCPVNHVLVNSFGIGGQNACLVLRKWNES